MKRALLIGLLGGLVQGESTTVCPESWGEGKNKCYKFIGKRMKIKEAGATCRRLKGRLFTPEDETEIKQVQEIARQKSFGLKWPVHYLWVGYKIKNPSSKQYPPEVVRMNNKPPAEWLEKSNLQKNTGQLWDPKVKKNIRFGQNARAQMRNIRMNKGKWSLTKPGVKSFGAAALCEIAKPKTIVGDPAYCWQPQSDVFDHLEYNGNMAVSEQGFECTNWNDESVHPHLWKNVSDSHNYCRNPGNEGTGPWCYVNDSDDKWDYCSVQMCKEPENEFVRAQADCGKRPIIDGVQQRVIGGRDAVLGEVPYQMRLRYYKKLSIGGKMTDHQCGGTMISSCWAITAAHCIPTEFWFTSKGGAQFWFRVDVGNRYYQRDVLTGSQQALRATDLNNHQTMRVKQVIMHPRYTGAENDLALIELFPSSENGECAMFTETVQPTCINQEHHRFPEGTKCTISGWGDVGLEEQGIQQPDVLQVSFVKVHNFEECAAAYKPLSRFLKTRKHLCAKGSGTDTCQGDSGGPLVCFLDRDNGKAADANVEDVQNTGADAFRGKQAFLAGVVSFGAGCANEKFPGVYVPTSYFFDWIKKEVDKAGPSDYNEAYVCRDPQCTT